VRKLLYSCSITTADSCFGLSGAALALANRARPQALPQHGHGHRGGARGRAWRRDGDLGLHLQERARALMLDPWRCNGDVIWRKASTGTGRPCPWSDRGGVRRGRGCGGPRPWTGRDGGTAAQSTAAEAEEAEARCVSDIGAASGMYCSNQVFLILLFLLDFH
jgi:hypothetical protein